MVACSKENKLFLFFGGGGWGLMILLAGELFVYFNGGILRND